MTIEFLPEQLRPDTQDDIADDLGLIYESLLTGYQDAWLDRLTGCYRNGKVPNGER